MKNILVLGAGQSTPYLVSHLLGAAEENGWFVTLGDRDLALARKRLRGHPCGNAVQFDVTDAGMRASQIRNADVVVNMLPPAYQLLVALDCVHYRTHMVSASYEDAGLRDLERDANRNGVLILSECGLDPGIDHMSAMALIRSVRSEGGRITRFRSYGAGLPEPGFQGNPLRYAITWNPRNVVMAGEGGATYVVDGKVKVVPWHEVFQRTWSVEIDGVGTFEAYPNRDSLNYQNLFGLDSARTAIRGTLRYPGWCETWLQLVRLGAPNERMRFPTLHGRTYREVLEMFLPVHLGDGALEDRIAQFLGISPTGRIMENLRWLGLFSDDAVPTSAHTVAEVMTQLLVDKLRLGEGDRDIVILHHDLEVEHTDGREERIRSSMVEYGERGGTTAMARLVGLPAAIAAGLIVNGDLPLTGCHIPTHPAVFTRVLAALRDEGLEFRETREGPG
jgi:saccharopine dehydrogenase-like NADP-dependent oxidoreductase